MNFEFNPTIWFICKLCNKSCSDTEELKTHKLENHLGDCIKIKCIIFEEKLLSYDWTPEDQNKLVENQRPNDESMKPKHGNGSSSVTVLKQNKNFRNPYISIPRVPLKATEQLISGHLAVNRNLASNSVRSYGRKQPRETQQADHSLKPATVRTETDFAKQTRAPILAKQTHESDLTQISEDIKIEAEDDTRDSNLPSLTISKSIFEACSTDANAAVGSPPPPPPVKQSMFQVHRSGPKVQTASKLFNATIPSPSLPIKKSFSSVLPLDPGKPKPVLKTYSRKPSVTPGTNAVRIMGDAKIFSDEVEAIPKKAVPAPTPTPTPNKKRNRSKIVITVLSSDDKEEDKSKLNKTGKRRRIPTTRVPSPKLTNVKTAVKKRPAKSPSVGTKKRGRKANSKSPVCWVPLSFPQWLRLLKEKRLNGRNQIQGKSQQNSQQSIFPENIILLDPDPTSADFDPKLMGQENGVTCLLCSTKLVTQSELQLHADNCWFHNQVLHRYCVPCGIGFENPLHLGQHRLHAHFDPIPGNDLPNIDLPVDLDRDETDSDSIASSSASLGQWIRKLEAKKNGNLPFPKIIILLDPDPTAENYVNSHESHFDPIKCKLCETSLGSETEVKKHVARCWTHHKNRHRFCVFCQRSWKTPWYLRVHNKLNHEEGPKFPFECHLCHTGFLNELDWKRHAMSLAEFRPIVSSKRKRAKQRLDKIAPEETSNSNDAPAPCTSTKSKKVNKRKSTKYAFQLENESAESEGETFSGTFGDWMKEQREGDPWNIIRVHPDPTEAAYELDAFEMSEANPVSCNLCQTAFTSEKLLRRHLLKCWLHNKRSHRYCVPCERVFLHAKYLDRHNSKMHCSTPRPTFTCRLCPSTFVDRRGVIRHEWINHGNVGEKLELLPTRVSSVKLKAIQEPRLKISLESRIQLKPFKCELCGIGFPYNFLLQKHHTTCRHSPQTYRFLKCPHADCSEKFKYQESLERHLDYAHSCSNVERAASKKFQCREPGCSTAVKFLKNLLVHLAKVHGRSKAEFACSSCPKIFLYKEHLEYHERIHRRERPFKCSVDGCESSFMVRVGLYHHLRAKHYKTLGLPEHLCPVCGKMYGLKGHLEKHILLTHNKADK